jgi:glycosyltransferase involved in cell wall biosynthesis
MRVALLLTTYNRPNYLKKCLWSLERANWSKVDNYMIIDDASTDAETLSLLNQFQKKPDSIRQINPVNQGICKNLLQGYEYLFGKGYTHVINLDSDAIIRPELFTTLLKHYKPNTLLTGFHSTTRSANGSERHIIKSETKYLYLKESVGGINFLIDKAAYVNFVKPALEHCIADQGNFDHISCINAGGAYCLKQSLVQHIGFDSTLNHFENPDTADTFYYWDLPDVTLLCIDSHQDRIQEPLRKCTGYIKFGDVQLIHPDIRSKEQYSAYCIDHMHEHIHTSHVLVFQYDGYVNNWMAWDNDWLQYDYIGAPWYYQDGMDVGNGGFSLRSKRLMQLASEICKFKHPEDHHICRTYRRELEALGMKFAPREVAEKFAFEGYLQPTTFLDGQFGRHGVNLRTAPERPIVTKRYVVNQFLSLGDILFLIPMIRELILEGNQVLWPIDERYLPIRKHFPDIPFVPKADYNLPYEARGRVTTEHGELLPYRFASELQGLTLRDCMRAKYSLYHHDYRIWRKLYWKRDYENEVRLITLLNLPEKFNLINQYYGHLGELTVQVNVQNDMPQVHMSNIPGYTLIDWLGVVERASEIHMANSSLNYLIELMDIDVPVYLYKRGIWGEQGYEYSSYLFENKCFRWT